MLINKINLINNYDLIYDMKLSIMTVIKIGLLVMTT